MRTLLDAFAAYERALIRGRTKAALAVLKAQGRRTRGVPYGRRAVEGRLVEDPAEQAAVARARALRPEGKSLRGVAAGLVKEGLRPRNRGVWAVQTIRRLVATT